MSQSLSSLVKSANPKAFHDAVRTRLEQDRPVSLEAATFEEVTLTGFDFSDIDLTHAAFENCTLSECRFVDTTLEGAFFDGTTLLHCHFEGGNLEGLAIDASTLGSCTFEQVAVDDAEWTDSRLDDCILHGVKAQTWWMERVTFKGGKWRDVAIEGGSWSHVTLREMSIQELNLEGVDIIHCYHVHTALPDGEWPGGFIEKSGRRKTL